MRPVRFPPPGPWWCSGFEAFDAYAIVIAYLRPEDSVTDWWPEASHIDSEPCDRIIFTDRFPRPDWYKGGVD
jgi:hypothetical protein